VTSRSERSFWFVVFSREILIVIAIALAFLLGTDLGKTYQLSFGALASGAGIWLIAAPRFRVRGDYLGLFLLGIAAMLLGAAYFASVASFWSPEMIARLRNFSLILALVGLVVKFLFREKTE
jgi:hypothetical protein